MKPIWATSDKTYIWLFNVGRGLSICIRLPNNLGIIYDLGCSDSFSPIEFIEENILPHLDKYGESGKPAQLIVSHPHQDHIQEANLVNESDSYACGLVTLPHNKDVEEQEDEKVDFLRIENDDNKELISEYNKLHEGRNPPLCTLDPKISSPSSAKVVCGLYYMRPPEVDKIHVSNDHHYGNGLSLGFYLRHNDHSIWISGDVTPEVHNEVLAGSASIEKRFTYLHETSEEIPDDFHTKTSTQPTLEELLDSHGLDLLVAPHHGLESCFCQALFDAIPGGRTQLNIISEKRKVGETDGKVDSRYSSKDYASGLYVDIDGCKENKKRRQVSTRNGHHMLFIIGRNSPRPKVFLRKNAKDLLHLK